MSSTKSRSPSRSSSTKSRSPSRSSSTKSRSPSRSSSTKSRSSSTKSRSRSRSRSLKDSDKRTFTINNAYHVDGCKTKFSNKDYTGRFVGHSAERAAMKALTELCFVKRIKGQCTLYIEMRETTQSSKHKLYAYHCKRVKKDKPLVIPGRGTYNYDIVCKPVRIPTEKCKKSRKTSGKKRSSSIVSKTKKIKIIKMKKSKTKSKKPTKSFFNSLF
jgi:hypothetical protein